MSAVISISFPHISGVVSGHTAFVRDEAGALLNTGGDTILETGSTGVWTFTLSEVRVTNASYLVRIYSGSVEVTDELVFDGVLHAGQLLVDKVGDSFLFSNRTIIRGVVGATAPSTSSFTPSGISPAGSVANQWNGRVIIFDNNTTTVGLRGQGTVITSCSAAALPLLTFVALTTAPVSGDSFSIT